MTPGEQIRITARVNNTLHWQSIPPGVIEDTPAGPRQRYWHDFFNYAGIHRNVWLFATPAAYIADLTVTTDLDGDNGEVSYTADTVGAEGTRVRAVLRDADGAEVASAGGIRGSLQVPNVHKWAPGDGYLYDLELQLINEDVVVDSYTRASACVP